MSQLATLAGRATESREPQIENFDDRRLTRFHADKQVARFDVAVDGAFFMDVLQPQGGLPDIVSGDRNGDHRLPFQDLPEVFAVDKFHHQEMAVADAARIIGSDNIRMLQRSDRLNFPFEPCDGCRVAAEFSIKNLKRDQSPESLLLGEEHCSHSALAERLHQFVPAEKKCLMPGQQFLRLPLRHFPPPNHLGRERSRRSLPGQRRQKSAHFRHRLLIEQMALLQQRNETLDGGRNHQRNL